MLTMQGVVKVAVPLAERVRVSVNVFPLTFWVDHPGGAGGAVPCAAGVVTLPAVGLPTGKAV